VLLDSLKPSEYACENRVFIANQIARMHDFFGPLQERKFAITITAQQEVFFMRGSRFDFVEGDVFQVLA
jgi:hypothetical protein